MFDSQKISHKGFLAVVVLLMTEFAFVAILSVEIAGLQSKMREEQQQRKEIAQITKITGLFHKLCIQVTRDELLLPTQAKRSEQLDHSPPYEEFQQGLAVLEQQLKNEPERLQNIQKFRANSREVFGKIKRLRRTDGGADAMVAKELLRGANQLSRDAQKVIGRYGGKVSSKKDSADRLTQIKLMLGIGLLINFVTVLAAGLYFLKRVASRITVITENAARLARSEPLHPPLDGTDEVSQIDAVFHRLIRDLSKAAEQERILIENSTDVICSIDSRGVFTEVSSASREQWGYDPQDLLGQKASDVLGTKDTLLVFQQSREAATHDSHFVVDQQIIRSDGTLLDTLWSVHWSPDDGSLFCFVRDDTESKKINNLLIAQENQIRSVIENMPLGILTINQEGKIRSANEAARQIFDGSDDSKNHIDGESIEELIVPLENKSPSLTAALWKASDATPLRCSVKAGKRKTHVDVSVGRSATHRDDSIVVLLEDASERVRLEELKRDFISLLGENLRSPIANVRQIVLAQLQAARAEDAKLKERLNRTVLNMDRLLNLIDELLNLEKLGKGKLVGTLAPYPVSNIITAAIDAVHDHAEQQKIELSAESSPSHVMADYQRLVQVLVNLLSNAIKYSAAGSSVSLKVHEIPGFVEFNVIDQGRGIPAELHEKIFESYVQTQKSDAKRGVGTGLGLAICKQIIDNHNGTIGVTSEVGQGSTFWIRLPRLERRES